MIKINYEILPKEILISLDEFQDNNGEPVKLSAKIKISEENNKEDFLKSWLKQVSTYLILEAKKKTIVEVEKLTDDIISTIVLEYLYPIRDRLKDVKEILRLLECQREDYNQRNFGDANGWDRHIRMAQEKFEDKYNQSPWDFMRSYTKSLEKTNEEVN